MPEDFDAMEACF